MKIHNYKGFHKFNEDTESTESIELDKLNNSLLYFTSNIKKLEDAMKKKDSNLIKKIVANNTLLTEWMTLIGINDKITTLENRIKYYTEAINSRRSDMAYLSKIQDSDEKKIQTDKINNEISEKNLSISDMRKEIPKLQKEYNDKKKYIDELIKKMKSRVAFLKKRVI
jgi:uncharacterized coiled-coil DUF342 family protein